MEQRDYLIVLYDYYGQLLSEDNRKYFEDYYFDNLSLAEIAQNDDISRNAVHKHIKSTEAKLLFYEEKLELFKKEKRLKSLIAKVKDEKLRKELNEVFE